MFFRRVALFLRTTTAAFAALCAASAAIPAACQAQGYSIQPGPLTSVEGFSTQSDSYGDVSTYNFTLSDFGSSPPLPPGIHVCLIQTSTGWLPQSSSATNNFEGAGGNVQDVATITLSSDGTYTLTRKRTGFVFDFLQGYQGTLNDLITINLNTGDRTQSTTGNASSADPQSGGNYQQQFTIDAVDSLLTGAPGCSSSAVIPYLPPLPLPFPRLLSATDIQSLPLATALATDGASAVVLFASVPDPSAPVTFSIISPTIPLTGTGPSLQALNGSLDNNGLNPSLDVSPIVTENGNYAAAFLHAPDTYLGVETGTESLNVSVTQQGASIGTATVVLVPPPLVLVHGIWSDSKAWGNLVSCLNNPIDLQSSDEPSCPNSQYYPSPAIFAVDYSPYHDEAFSNPDIQKVIGDAFNGVLYQCAIQGIACQSSDVVAHSMGGLATKFFMTQSPSNPSLVHRFITAGTPSLGTPLADKLFLYKSNTVQPGTFLDAVAKGLLLLDAAYEDAVPPELVELLTSQTLATYFYTAGMNVTGGGVQSLTTDDIKNTPIAGGFSPVKPLAIQGIAPPNTLTEAFFNLVLANFGTDNTCGQPDTVACLLQPQNDTVVPGASQIAGASSFAPIDGIVHASPAFTYSPISAVPTETTSADVYSQVFTWLIGQAFPQLPSTKSTRGAISPQSLASTGTSLPTLASINMAQLTQVNADNFQVDPSSGSTISAGEASAVTFSSSTKTLLRVVCIPAVQVNFTDITAEPFIFNIEPTNLSPIAIIVAVFFTDNTYAIGVVQYSIQPPSQLIVLSANVSAVTLMNVGDTAQLTMTGRYANNSTVDVTNNVNYALGSTSTSVASVTTSGLVKAVGNGADSITFSYEGAQYNIPVIVGGCSYKLASASPFVPGAGGTVPINLSTGAGCQWSVTSDSWLAVAGSQTGTGTATLQIQVSANDDGASRSGMIKVANQRLTILQSAAGCSFSVIAPSTSVSASGASLNIPVNAGDGCAWAASSDSGWIMLSPGGGSTGPGSVGVLLGANSGPTRTANLYIAGQMVNLTQEAVSTRPTPVFMAGGVVNSGSFKVGALSPGEIITIFGTNIGPSQAATLGIINNVVQSQLAGVSVLFDGVPSPIIYSSSQQMNLVVPYSINGKPQTTVQVVYAGLSSPSVTMPVAPSSPAFFTSNASGAGQGAFLNQDGSYNSDSNPAQRGTVLVLYATGGGQTTPSGIDGALAVSATLPSPILPVSVSIGGQMASVLYAGAAPGYLAGLMQINVLIPTSIEAGDQAVVLTVGQASSPAGVTAAVW